MRLTCWKGHCTESPPWFAVHPTQPLGALFSCTDHVGQAARMGFDVHEAAAVLRDPKRRLGENVDVLYAALAAQRHRGTAT